MRTVAEDFLYKTSLRYYLIGSPLRVVRTVTLLSFFLLILICQYWLLPLLVIKIWLSIIFISGVTLFN